MRVREIKYRGRQVWPPQWSNSNPEINEKGVLKGVKLVFGTDLLRIDVEHNRIPYLAIILVEKEVCKAFYRKLKQNVGKLLGEIADLEIEIN
jgi:hypothetical protein